VCMCIGKVALEGCTHEGVRGVWLAVWAVWGCVFGCVCGCVCGSVFVQPIVTRGPGCECMFDACFESGLPCAGEKNLDGASFDVRVAGPSSSVGEGQWM
jgi:hypothetical protein